MTSIEISHCNGNAQLAAIFNMSRQSLNRVEIIHIVDTTLFQDLNFEMESLRFLRIASVNNIELTELLQSCSNLRELELSAAGISTKLANNMMSSLTYMKIELIEKTTLPINLINSAATTLEYLKLGNVKREGVPLPGYIYQVSRFEDSTSGVLFSRNYGSSDQSLP